MSTLLLHNMMVEVHMGQGEVESSDFYITETITMIYSDEQSSEGEGEKRADENTTRDNTEEEPKTDDDFIREKYFMTQKRWKELYDAQSALRLQDVLKKQLYSECYINVDLSAFEMEADFDHLTF